MIFIAETFILLFLISLVIFMTKMYWYLTKDYNYWRDRGVPCKTPQFPFGSTKDLVLGKTFIGDGYDKLYKEYANNRYFGIIDVQNPVLVLRDPDLVKAIMVKDFNYFSVRTYIGANPKEYILRHVINMNGNEWKEMRSLLTPAFSSAKMKFIFELMETCSNRLVKEIYRMIQENEVPVVEITDIIARFTMDVIASCAFGLETDCISDKNCKCFDTIGAMLRTSKGRFFRRFIVNFFPFLAKIFPLKLIPCQVTKMLTDTVRDSVEYRKKFNLLRNDFLDVLIQAGLKNAEKNKEIPTPENTGEGLTIEQMTAQAFVFFIAGYTTDTSILSFCLSELAQNVDIQNKLYEDIENVLNKHEGQITHQALQDMCYMDHVVNETLRLYGSGQILIRTCTKQYKIPDSDVVLEPGIRVVIPTYSLHHDSKYFPEPYKFNPERFAPHKIKERNPFVFLPFGEGPRNCIGRNFGLLHIKIGLASIINNFYVELSPNQRVPIEIDKRCIVVTPAHPIFLKFSKR